MMAQAGVFTTDNGDPIRIWLDPTLPSHSDLYPLLRSHGAEIATRHGPPETHLLILHPSSLKIYDRYCHPSWLPMSGKNRYQRLLQAGGVAEWKFKVLLTENWPKKCIAAGRLLGEDDNWAGSRKGGPPSQVMLGKPLPVDRPLLATVNLRLARPPTLPDMEPHSASRAASTRASTPPRASRAATPERQSPEPQSPRSLATPERPRQPSESSASTPPTTGPQPASRRRPVATGLPSRISDEDLQVIFTEVFPYFASGSKTNSEIAAELLAKHATYTQNSWAQLFQCFRNRTGRFAHRPDMPPGIARRTTKAPVPAARETSRHSSASSGRTEPASLVERQRPTARPSAQATRARETVPPPAESLEDIVRNAHPMLFIEGRILQDVTKHLALVHPDVGENSWIRHYYDWRTAIGRFRSLKENKDYEQYKDVFPSYLPLVRRGVSLNDIADRLVKEQSSDNSAAEWNVLFGNWLRVHPVEEERPATPPLPPADIAPSPAPVPAEQSPAPTSAASIPYERTPSGLAEIFRNEFNSSSWDAYAVAIALAADIRFKRTSIIQWYDHWRRGTGPFANIDRHLRYTNTGAPVPSSPDSTPPPPSRAKRAREASPRAGPTKRAKSTFTPEEEAKMAVYIASRCPKFTEPFEEDWEPFQKENPGRPVGDWTEHHRRYRAKINDLVVKLGGVVPGRRANARRQTQRAGSDDSVEFVDVLDKREVRKAVEVFEVLDSSEGEA